MDLLAEWLPKVDRNLYTVTSPPVIVRDVVVVGSGLGDSAGPVGSTPPGDVRGYDVKTGKLLWTFHSVPHQGEFGSNGYDVREALGSGWDLVVPFKPAAPGPKTPQQ